MASSLTIGLLSGDGLVLRFPEVSRTRLECSRESGRGLQLLKSNRPFQLSKQLQCSTTPLVSRRGREFPRPAVAEDRAVEANVAEVEDGVEEAGVSDALETSQGLERWIIKGERAFNQLATDAVIQVLDVFYKNRDYARFYVLETIARVPYFAFVSVLHMYESFGWWRRADYIKVHFAESWNELHHLLTMEALGGDERWVDRFLAQHIAVGYYLLTVVMYLLSPRMAYHFSECVEKHAFHTYDEFIKLHGEDLKKLPAPEVAVRYYTEGDLYMFDEFQTGRTPNTRRPKVENLYDVFYNIREDEAEHCKTMLACQTRGNLRSPHSAMHAPAASPASVAATAEAEEKLLEIIKDLPPAECAGIIECALTSSSFVERARKNGIEISPTVRLLSLLFVSVHVLTLSFLFRPLASLLHSSPPSPRPLLSLTLSLTLSFSFLLSLEPLCSSFRQFRLGNRSAKRTQNFSVEKAFASFLRFPPPLLGGDFKRELAVSEAFFAIRSYCR